MLLIDGTVMPMQQVNLVARVPGILISTNFKDGDRVKEGQLLFTIEQPPYVEQLNLAQAKLDQARSDYQRQTQLLSENAASQASVENSRANLQQAQANVNIAKINLTYTEIRAPFTGVIGRRMVDPGNFVGATPGGTVLATIMQIAPAYVSAAVGEREVLRLRGMLHGRASANVGDGNINAAVGHTVVHAQLQGDAAAQETGVLDFIDHQLGQSSGTVAVRGRFDNKSLRLIPGFYAKLSIDLGGKRDVLVLPRSVIQADQQGEFVYVVASDQFAHRRNISSAPLTGEDREVTKGLSPGESVVVEGQGRLSDGAKVQAKTNEKVDNKTGS
jgi:RND family efflux transporter MFP subunit